MATVESNSLSSFTIDITVTDKEIDRGAYGRVFEVDYAGTICAAKEMHALLLECASESAQAKLRNDFQRECSIWSKLRHPSVVTFLGVNYPKGSKYKLPLLVMEKMECSLRGFLDTHTRSQTYISMLVKLSILHDVSLGLQYLHSLQPPLIHRDLSTNNILLSRCLEAKITDLGVAKFMQENSDIKMSKVPGTLDFMSPESLVDNAKYGPSLDIFSYGGIILHTITQIWPTPSSHITFHPQTKRKIYLSEIERRQEYVDKMKCYPEIVEIVKSCMDDNPDERPKAAAVCKRVAELKSGYSSCTDKDGMDPISWLASLPKSTANSQKPLVKPRKLSKASNASSNSSNDERFSSTSSIGSDIVAASAGPSAKDHRAQGGKENKIFCQANSAPSLVYNKTSGPQETDDDSPVYLTLQEINVPMPPDRTTSTNKSRPEKHQNSSPMHPKTTWCMALYAYSSGEDNDIYFERGDVITVLSLTNQNWWRGKANGKEGYFPTNYVQVLEPGDKVAKLLIDYKPAEESSDHVSISANKFVTVKRECSNGWSKGIYRKKLVYIPTSYIDTVFQVPKDS